MLRIKYRAARPKLRAAEQRAGGGPWGAPKKRPWTALRGARDSGPCPRALPDRYRGPRSSALAGALGRPEKAALDHYSGARDSGPRLRALPDRYRGPRSSALAGVPGAPRKSGLGPLLGVMRTRASPALSVSELTKNRSSGM